MRPGDTAKLVQHRATARVLLAELIDEERAAGVVLLATAAELEQLANCAELGLHSLAVDIVSRSLHRVRGDLRDGFTRLATAAQMAAGGCPF